LAAFRIIYKPASLKIGAAPVPRHHMRIAKVIRRRSNL
jgi:hypothetical protein